MATTVDKLVSEIRQLPDAEKLRLLDAILTDLDTPDPEIDRIWAMKPGSAGRPTRLGGFRRSLTKT